MWASDVLSGQNAISQTTWHCPMSDYTGPELTTGHPSGSCREYSSQNLSGFATEILEKSLFAEMFSKRDYDARIDTCFSVGRTGFSFKLGRTLWIYVCTNSSVSERRVFSRLIFYWMMVCWLLIIKEVMLALLALAGQDLRFIVLLSMFFLGQNKYYVVHVDSSFNFMKMNPRLISIVNEAIILYSPTILAVIKSVYNGVNHSWSRPSVFNSTLQDKYKTQSNTLSAFF